MRKINIIILFITLLITSSFDLEKRFGKDHQDALAFLSRNKETINRELGNDKPDINLMVAIVFPEIVRFSMFRDFFETSALKTLYVKYGHQTVDFSIGRFQMKPSFIETLENTILNHAELKKKYGCLIIFKDEKPAEKRKERVLRLTNLSWQLRYLNCFFDYMHMKYPDTIFSSTEEKVKFYATAYNHGFLSSEKEIKKWIHKKTFPYGAQHDNPYTYSDIAYAFYQKHDCLTQKIQRYEND